MHFGLHESYFPDITISRLFIISGFSNAVDRDGTSFLFPGVVCNIEFDSVEFFTEFLIYGKLQASLYT
jgi:hypothetical protein